jgi:hypothetical protein
VTVGRFITAVLVGLVLIDMTGPAITRHKPGPALELWLGAAVLLVGTLALLLWHRRRMFELRKQYLLSDDWEKVPPWARDDFWACPRCGNICPSVDAAERHLDPETSPCAALQAHREALESSDHERREAAINRIAAAARPGAGWPAGVVGDGLNDDQDNTGSDAK